MDRCPRPDLEPAALVGLALMLLVMELPWVGAFLISGLVHECCHLLALRIQGVPVHRITIGLTGAKIETSPMTRRQELTSALAGPLGGLFLCFLAPKLPRVAVCAFFHSVCNLFPLYPLDGGRALRCLLPRRFAKVFEESIILIIIVAAIRFAGFLGVFLLAVIIGRPLLEKYLAKRHGNSYNSPTIS